MNANNVHNHKQLGIEAVRLVIESLYQAGIRVWLDGGWGVDALLGRQTRPHHDLDIIVSTVDVPELLDELSRLGFAICRGTPPHAFVLSNEAGHEVDVHAVVFNENGSAAHRMENGEDWIFPAESFTGTGTIEDLKVLCLSAKAQVICHAQGYKPTEKDYRDMELLAEHFGVDLPPILQRSKMLKSKYQ
jgi:lincosamide nucleotidyltransferase A/C/D/E